LQITDLNYKNTIQLPQVYSRSSLPIPTEAIATQQDMNCWPYLRGVIIPTIEAEMRLLIRSDVPQALQPREFRTSDNSGPFATRTVLGWVLNSLLGRTTSKSPTANFA